MATVGKTNAIDHGRSNGTNTTLHVMQHQNTMPKCRCLSMVRIEVYGLQHPEKLKLMEKILNGIIMAIYIMHKYITINLWKRGKYSIVTRC